MAGVALLVQYSNGGVLLQLERAGLLCLYSSPLHTFQVIIELSSINTCHDERTAILLGSVIALRY